MAAPQAIGQSSAPQDLDDANGAFTAAPAVMSPDTSLPSPTPGIGQWDGVTASAHLENAYEDARQLNVPLGIISYYNQPWRGYMDTWPASQYLNSTGAMWNLPLKYAEPVGELLQESGIHSIRAEICWGSMGWNDDLTAGAKAQLQTFFGVLKRHGIRPLILLNAHHGLPCPYRFVTVQVAAAAKSGATTLKLTNPVGVRPGYTGIQNPAYIAAYPVVTKLDADGTAHLSSGLPFNVKAGPLTLIDLKYQPFQGVKLADGTPVPAAQDTFNGWMKYVAAVGRAARDAMGTAGQADAGFDLEVWNEYTFGSNFLDINNYYDQKFTFSAPFTYQKTRPQTGLRPGAKTTFTSQGVESILPMTVDYFADPANGFPGVKVISGFSNQRPWDNGGAIWPGQAGFSRHLYTGGWTDCSRTTQLGNPGNGTIDALQDYDGKQVGNDWTNIIPGTDFIPTFRCAFPEFWHSGFKTEGVWRDVGPDSRLSGVPLWAGVHGRYTNNGDLHPAEVWQTETNYWRAPFLSLLQRRTGVAANDPRLHTLDQWLDGKMLLRQYLFHAHKGLSKTMVYCLGADSCSFGMIPQALLTALDQSNGVLTEQVRQTVPPSLKAMTWINSVMSTGQALAAPRPLAVKDVVEYKPRLVFAGDGSAAHPNRWNRDELALLPFQLSASQYEIPFYVATLDVTHVWNRAAGLLDPARYDMPEQDYDVTLSNIDGQGATVSAYDPLHGVTVPVAVVASTPTTLTVHLKAVDYPRFLQINEPTSGPLILQPKAQYVGGGQVKVTWNTNVPVKAVVTYGGDWTARNAKTITLPASTQLSNSVTIPNCTAGVPAVRIKVTSANGLVDVWPRWDEDPSGQVVIPAAK